MKKTIAVILLCCLTVSMACVPTPDHEIVVYQGDQALEDMINATAEAVAPDSEAAPDKTSASEEVMHTPAPYQAPERIQESYPLGIGDAQVIFDAPVSVPFSDRYQVYEVSKAKPTVTQAVQIIRAFFGNGPVYSGQYSMTKAEYAELLKYCDESPEIQEENRNMQASGFEYTVQYFIKDEMDTAPLSREDTALDLDQAAFPIRAYGKRTGDNTFYQIQGDDRDDYCVISITPENMYLANERLVYSGIYPGAPSGRKLNKLSVTREEAVAAADAFLSEAGIDWMAVSDTESLLAEYSHRLIDVPISQGWKLVYHHAYNGVTGVNQQYSGTLAEDQYRSPWPQETIWMYVDAEGVRYFEWCGMSEAEKVKENELVIMPFEEILQIIKNRLKIENAYAEVDKTREIRVTSIELGYCVIPKKNDGMRGYTVPAWIISYEENSLLGDAPHTSYRDFVIDAVTGANIQTAAASQ